MRKRLGGVEDGWPGDDGVVCGCCVAGNEGCWSQVFVAKRGQGSTMMPWLCPGRAPYVDRGCSLSRMVGEGGDGEGDYVVWRREPTKQNANTRISCSGRALCEHSGCSLMQGAVSPHLRLCAIAGSRRCRARYCAAKSWDARNGMCPVPTRSQIHGRQLLCSSWSKTHDQLAQTVN